MNKSIKSSKTLRICKKRHKYYKSSDCPVCPECEKQKSINLVFSNLSAPAQRALESAGIKSIKKLSKFSEKEILNLHGIGQTAIPKLKQLLENAGLNFKN